MTPIPELFINITPRTGVAFTDAETALAERKRHGAAIAVARIWTNEQGVVRFQIDRTTTTPAPTHTVEP